MNDPLIYEINTRCWLRELSAIEGKAITLDCVPEREFKRWQGLGFTHIWLMGIWTTGPRSRAQSLNDPYALKFYSHCLPDWREEDVSGSPFAISDYKTPASMGGDTGLRLFRQKLRLHGMKLMLDFVPNHLGLDHALVVRRSELFVQTEAQEGAAFLQEAGEGAHWVAFGRDPNFPSWIDTAQLDYRRADTHTVMTEMLQSVAQRCDGVRCDMAMLLLADVFEKTWHDYPCDGPRANREFWPHAIRMVKEKHPDFLFLGEVYWDLEPRLQSLGFDYVYDKRVYDSLALRRTSDVQRHLLSAQPEFIRHTAHFLENHDEVRISTLLTPEEHRAAALLVLGLPGLRLLHDGELTGSKVQSRVQLNRRPLEVPDALVVSLYEKLLATLPQTAVGRGEGFILKPNQSWVDNYSAQNFVVVQWQNDSPEFDLVVVNLAGYASQCYVTPKVAGLADVSWEMEDLLGDQIFNRIGEDIQTQGLYLDVPAHGAQLFHFKPLTQPVRS